MTHFVGFVVAPAGADLDALLAPYDEEKETPRYLDKTRVQVIEEQREKVAHYASPKGLYGRFIADPGAYVEAMVHHKVADGHSFNHDHLNYLVKEFPQRLTATDEQLYSYGTYSDTDVDSDGNHYSTYNPDSIWDWWVIGGRWDGVHAPGNRTTVAAYIGRMADDLAYIPPRVLFDQDGVLKQGTEGWFGFTDNSIDDVAWRTSVIERLNTHADDEVVTFLDLHI